MSIYIWSSVFLENPNMPLNAGFYWGFVLPFFFSHFTCYTQSHPLPRLQPPTTHMLKNCKAFSLVQIPPKLQLQYHIFNCRLNILARIFPAHTLPQPIQRRRQHFLHRLTFPALVPISERVLPFTLLPNLGGIHLTLPKSS